jgi:hypothetical protein
MVFPFDFSTSFIIETPSLIRRTVALPFVGDVKTVPRKIKEVVQDGIIVQYVTAANLLANITETTQIRATLDPGSRDPEAQGPI